MWLTPEALLELGDLDPLAGLDLAGEQRTAQQDRDVVDDADALDGVVPSCFHGGPPL